MNGIDPQCNRSRREDWRQNNHAGPRIKKHSHQKQEKINQQQEYIFVPRNADKEIGHDCGDLSKCQHICKEVSCREDQHNDRYQNDCLCKGIHQLFPGQLFIYHKANKNSISDGNRRCLSGSKQSAVDAA